MTDGTVVQTKVQGILGPSYHEVESKVFLSKLLETSKVNKKKPLWAHFPELGDVHTSILIPRNREVTRPVAFTDCGSFGSPFSSHCRIEPWYDATTRTIFNGRAGDRSVRRAILIKENPRKSNASQCTTIKKITSGLRLSKAVARKRTPFSKKGLNQIARLPKVAVNRFSIRGPNPHHSLTNDLKSAYWDKASPYTKFDTLRESECQHVFFSLFKRRKQARLAYADELPNSPASTAASPDCFSSTISSAVHQKNNASTSLSVAVKTIRDDSKLRRSSHKGSEVSAIYREALCYNLVQRRATRYRQLSQSHKTLPRFFTKTQMILGDHDYNTFEPIPLLQGYFINKKNHAESVLVTQLLSGPDLGQLSLKDFETSDNNCRSAFRRLWWCILLVRRLYQLHMCGIRHNDIKPSNFVVNWLRQEEAHQIKNDEWPSDHSSEKLLFVVNSASGDLPQLQNGVLKKRPLSKIGKLYFKNPLLRYFSHRFLTPYANRTNRCVSDTSTQAEEQQTTTDSVSDDDNNKKFSKNSSTMIKESKVEITLSNIDIKIVDLGCCTPSKLALHSGGTPAYLSPEQIKLSYYQHQLNRNSRSASHRSQHVPSTIIITKKHAFLSYEKSLNFIQIDERSDLWALGIVLCEILVPCPLLIAMKGKAPEVPKWLGHSWSIPPTVWAHNLKDWMFRNQQGPLLKCANQIFDTLVVEDPEKRGDVIDILLLLLEFALKLKGVSSSILDIYKKTKQLPSWFDTFLHSLL